MILYASIHPINWCDIRFCVLYSLAQISPYDSKQSNLFSLNIYLDADKCILVSSHIHW